MVKNSEKLISEDDDGVIAGVDRKSEVPVTGFTVVSVTKESAECAESGDVLVPSSSVTVAPGCGVTDPDDVPSITSSVEVPSGDVASLLVSVM